MSVSRPSSERAVVNRFTAEQSGSGARRASPPNHSSNSYGSNPTYLFSHSLAARFEPSCRTGTGVADSVHSDEHAGRHANTVQTAHRRWCKTHRRQAPVQTELIA